MSLDVRTKILLLMFANLAFLFRVTGWLETLLIVGLAFLLCLSNRRKMALAYMVTYLVFLVLDGNLTVFFQTHSFAFFTVLFIIGRLALPSFMAGSLLLGTSSSYELIHGLRKWYLPEGLLLTLAVMQRFLPAIREDSVRIHRALQVRGIFLEKKDVFLHPARYGEHLIVPLLMSLIRTAQDLTIASLTKGLALDKQVEESFPSRFRLADWSVCLWIFTMSLLILIP